MLGREHLLPFSRLLNVKKTRSTIWETKITRTYGRLHGPVIERSSHNSAQVSCCCKAVKHDHDYCSHKDFHDKSTQTNFDLPQELQGIKEDLQRLKEENDKLKAKLDDKETLKRELFMGDVLKNDESVKFYTGFPSLTCLMTLFSLIKPFCSNLKYWDSNKLSDVGYQKDSTINKPGRKRTFRPFEELILTLVRLRLGLLRNPLSDLFGISTASVSKTFRTWICFLGKILKIRFSFGHPSSKYLVTFLSLSKNSPQYE